MFLCTGVLPCTCTQVGFRHPKDYVSYVWARSDDGERCLEKQPCAQVSWASPAVLLGTCVPSWGDRDLFMLLMGQGGTSLLLCAEP